jgi:hypothetical protein
MIMVIMMVYPTKLRT